MKRPILIIGAIFFFIGAFTKIKFLIALGMILMITSFFGKVIKRKEKITQRKKFSTKQKRKIKSKGKCSNCGTEILHEDSYCPECGKKILP